MKKWISLLLCVAMALSVMPQSALAENDEPVEEPAALHEAETPIDPLTASAFSDGTEEDDPLEPAVPEQPATPEEDAPLEPIAPAEGIPAEFVPEQPTASGEDAPAEAEPAALPAPVIVRAQDGDVFERVKNGAIHDGDCVLLVGKYDDNYYVLTTERYPYSNKYFLLGELISGETSTLPDQIVYSSSSYMCALTLNKADSSSYVDEWELISSNSDYLTASTIDGYYLKLMSQSAIEDKTNAPYVNNNWRIDLTANKITAKNPVYPAYSGDTNEIFSIMLDKKAYQDNDYYRFSISGSGSSPIYLYRKATASAPQTYTVTYNANGGEGAPEAQSKTKGETLYLSDTMPTRAGYDFAGWAASPDGPIVYQPGGEYAADADLTLYAVWWEYTTVLGCSLNLSGKIGVNFYVQQSAEGARATLTCGAQSVSYDLNQSAEYYQNDQERYYLTFPNLIAPNLPDAVTLCLYDGANRPLHLKDRSGNVLPGTAFSYSAAVWAAHMLAGNDQKVKDLANALLNYGAYAQAYFHRPNPASPTLPTPTAEVAADARYNSELPAGYAACGYKGATLLLDGDTTLRLYFDREVACDGCPVRLEAENGYFVERAGISAPELGTKYEFVIRYNGAAYTFRCAALSYANDVINGNSSPETLVRLCQSLYLYFAAATNYFADRSESAPIPVID